MEHLFVHSRSSLANQGTFWSRADRLENEHLGNMDQYRITREVPLPYSFDEIDPETDAGDEDDEPQARKAYARPNRSEDD